MHAFMIVAARRARLWCDYKRCTTSSPLPSSHTPASLSQCATPNQPNRRIAQHACSGKTPTPVIPSPLALLEL